VLLPNFCGRTQAPPQSGPPTWDIVCVGTLSISRRMDILIELARQRPDLRIGVAGRGSRSDEVAAAARDLPNLDFIGWRENADEVLSAARIIYYGRDPEDVYSSVACPNTLYQALRHRKPLIFFCGGEAAEIAAEFKVGIRAEASVEAVSAAYDAAVATSEWEFDEAWEAVWRWNDLDRYLCAVAEALAIDH
jgi:glycosyltransferase involved in cell wall biosynthesis